MSGHAIDNASDLEDSCPTRRSPTIVKSTPQKGNSNYDIRNRFSWLYTYQFPLGAPFAAEERLGL